MKLILFDCDGTLVDSVRHIHDCMVQTFQQCGQALPSEVETRSIIGLSLNQAIAKLLKRDVDEEISQITANYKQNYTEMRSRQLLQAPLYQGVYDLVRALALQEKYILGIVTGNSRRGVRHVFDQHGLEEYFYVVRTADDCPSKPDPAMVLESCGYSGIDPSDTLIIGDAIYDMQMANNAKAKAVGVSWGYHSVSDLRDHGAHYILNKPDELWSVLKHMEN